MNSRSFIHRDIFFVVTPASRAASSMLPGWSKASIAACFFCPNCDPWLPVICTPIEPSAQLRMAFLARREARRGEARIGEDRRGKGGNTGEKSGTRQKDALFPEKGYELRRAHA